MDEGWFMPETEMYPVCSTREPWTSSESMDDGHIDAVDTPDRLLRTNAIYRDIYTTQNKASHDEKMAELETEEIASGREAGDND